MGSNLVVLGATDALVEALDLESRVKNAMLQFFIAEIDNPCTRRAYMCACTDFFRYALPAAGPDIASFTPIHVSAWIGHMKERGLSKPTIKQRLAAVRMLFQSLTRQQLLRSNPAAVVKGPSYSAKRGKTPMLDSAEVHQILAAIDTTSPIGLRDRAIIATMAYTFARVSAVTTLSVAGVFHQKQRLWLRLAEKGGQAKDVPCHHHLEAYLSEWIERAELAATPAAPLFQRFIWASKTSKVGADSDHRFAEAQRETSAHHLPHRRERTLSGKPMTQSLIWEMVQRRARDAGITSDVCNHTFRAAGITAYLQNGGSIERAAQIAGHASINTTKLYDRRCDDITLDEIERIRFASL